MEIIKHQISKEQNATHKTASKNKLPILAALGFLLIGLTITNIPIIYSQSSSEMADGEQESSDDGGGGEQESSDDGGGGEQESSDDGGGGEQESSDDGGGGEQESSVNGGGGEQESSVNGGGEQESSVNGGGEQDKQEICNNGIDDDGDGDKDEDDCQQQQQQDKQEICNNGIDDDGDGDKDEDDCQQQQHQDKQEICNNGIDDDGDGDKDEEDCQQQQQQDKQEICNNGIDDDGDGDKDDEDSDCKAEICGNDKDDDDDGKIDDEDSDCKAEICGNGKDDDDDGKIDGEDSDCKAEICGNGKDDDDDGKIDGEDSDCKAEICDNDADDDDDGKIDEEDLDCKAELRATGKFIVQVKNDNGFSEQPQDFELRIKVSEGKASPSNFVGAGPPGTTVEFSGGGKFSVITMRPGGYHESVGSGCPSGQIPQAFTCTFTYDDQEPPKPPPGASFLLAQGVASGGSVIGKISATGPANIIQDTPPDPDKEGGTPPVPDTGGSTTPVPDTGRSTTPVPDTGQGIQKPPLTPQPFTTYKSDEKSVSVNYPHDWQITENPNNVTFKSPRESSSDRFEEALRVLKVPYKDPLSALTDKIVGEARANLPSFQIINSSDTVLGGIPANSLVYTYTDNRVGTLQEMVVLTIKDDSAYIIGFIAELPKYNYYLPVIQQMINSIELSDNKPETSSLLPFIPQQAPNAGQDVVSTVSNASDNTPQQTAKNQNKGNPVLDTINNIFGGIMGNK